MTTYIFQAASPMLATHDHNHCFHCGLPIPDDTYFPIDYEQQQYNTCCAGCQAVAQSIIAAGLSSYYKNRTANAEQAALPPQEILDQLKLYDLPEVQAEFVQTLPENQKEAMLMLSGITCAACTWLIEQQLLRQQGIQKVELNYSTQRVRIRWDNTQIQFSDILMRIQKIGYSASPYDAQKLEQQAQQERKKMLIRIAVAGLASMQTMMFAIPTYLYHDIEPQYLTILHWAAFFMVLPAMFYSAQPFYLGAWRDFKNRRTGMDTPVAIALSLTFIAGLSALISNANQGMYFESIAMFVFFLLTGRFMEQNARRKAGDAAERLVKLVPAFCHKLSHYPNEHTEEAAVVALQKDDIIMVKAGEIIPVDGIVLDGESEVNEAMLTGEHLPIHKHSGSHVTAGTLNTTSPLIIQAKQIGNQTKLAHIVQLLDQALSQKPRLAELAEKYAAHFTLSLIIMAVPTFLGWWWYANASQALWITVSLLVITCPCALSLATPAALAASTGKLATNGILIARGHTLETLTHITDAVFDKTGTLTQGAFSVSQILNLSHTFSTEQLIHLAQQLEQQSEHPIAKAILNLPQPKHTLPENTLIQNRKNHIGQGISAEITLNHQTQMWFIGQPNFVAQYAGAIPIDIQNLIQQGSVITLGNSQGFQAAFLLNDTIKENIQNLFNQLRQQNIQIHILSGDNSSSVNQLANQLNITHRQAHATPEDKLNYIRKLQAQGKHILMLGDGINDAPVLAGADVSVAVAGSADVAREGADVLLLNDDLNSLPTLLQQAKRTQNIIRQNLTWATLYNVIVVPLAICGMVTPWIAALGMSLSSLLVVWNALRLRK